MLKFVFISHLFYDTKMFKLRQIFQILCCVLFISLLIIFLGNKDSNVSQNLKKDTVNKQLESSIRPILVNQESPSHVSLELSLVSYFKVVRLIWCYTRDLCEKVQAKQ